MNLKFSEAWEEIKLKVVFELRGICKCKKKKNLAKQSINFCCNESITLLVH